MVVVVEVGGSNQQTILGGDITIEPSGVFDVQGRAYLPFKMSASEQCHARQTGGPEKFHLIKTEKSEAGGKFPRKVFMSS